MTGRWLASCEAASIQQGCLDPDPAWTESTKWTESTEGRRSEAQSHRPVLDEVHEVDEVQ